MYGPNQDIHRQSPPLTSYLSVQMVRQLTPTLFNNRDEIKRDYVHVDDVVALLIAMIKAPARFAAEVVNIGSGTQVCVREIFETMRHAAGLGEDFTAFFQAPAAIWDKYPGLYAGVYPFKPDRF